MRGEDLIGIVKSKIKNKLPNISAFVENIVKYRHLKKERWKRKKKPRLKFVILVRMAQGCLTEDLTHEEREEHEGVTHFDV